MIPNGAFHGATPATNHEAQITYLFENSMIMPVKNNHQSSAGGSIIGAPAGTTMTTIGINVGTLSGGTGLTTLAAVKEYLGITGTTSDALLTNLIVRISRLLEAIWGQRIGLASYDEKRNGLNSQDLLTRRPIVSITSLYQSLDQVWDSSSLINPADYLWDSETGIIHLKAGGWFLKGFRNVRIVYDAGFDPIPPDIEQIAIRAVAREYRNKDAVGIISMSLKDGSFTKSKAEQLFESDIALISMYRDYAAVM